MGEEGKFELVYNGDNPNEVSSIIDGDNVTVYGFKVEHALTDQIQWNGNRGRTFFFQAEMPYDVTQENFGDKGYVCYRVADGVTEHDAYAIGCYHFFRDHHVVVNTGISCPPELEAHFHNSLAVYLDGLGVMKHIINDKGLETKHDDKLCRYEGDYDWGRT